MEIKDTYNTITRPSEAMLFKDKNSKFFGYAFPVLNEDDVKSHLETLKKVHHSARHWCYAYQLGTLESNRSYRANDDGEQIVPGHVNWYKIRAVGKCGLGKWSQIVN